MEDLKLDDGTNRIFICDGGDRDDVSEEMKQLINYIAGRTYESDLADRINAEVKDAIRHDKWRTEYMSYLNAMLDSFEEGEKKGLEKGIEQGRVEGKEEGIKLHLIKQICRKLTKDKSPEEIADELEESLESVNFICAIAARYAPDYDPEKISDEMLSDITK